MYTQQGYFDVAAFIDALEDSQRDTHEEEQVSC